MERQSNIELFRIVACFFILIVHCNGWFLKEWGNIQSWYAGRDVFVGFSRTFIQSFSCIGVDCFILISGYFSIKPKIKSLVNIVSILLFFYIGTYLCNCWYTKQPIQIIELFKHSMVFSRENWFVQCYLFLLLLSPMINMFASKISEQQLLRYVLVFLFCAFYFGCIHDSKYFYFNRGYSITSFILIYLVGRYIGLYGVNKFRNISTLRLFLMYCCSIGVIMLVRWLPLDEEQYLSYSSPFLIVSASILLLCFTRINIQNRIINWIASSSLAVFIFHVSTPIIHILANYDVNIFMNNSFGVYIMYISIAIIICFFLAVLLDKIRYFLFKPILKFFDEK